MYDDIRCILAMPCDCCLVKFRKYRARVEHDRSGDHLGSWNG